MEDHFLVFYVTHPDEACAKRISEALLQERLIACVNIHPMNSAYWWDGEISDAAEWVSILKTRLTLEQRVEAAIESLHPYQTPCIMRFEVRANAAYLAWIKESTVQ